MPLLTDSTGLVQPNTKQCYRLSLTHTSLMDDGQKWWKQTATSMPQGHAPDSGTPPVSLRPLLCSLCHCHLLCTNLLVAGAFHLYTFVAFRSHTRSKLLLSVLYPTIICQALRFCLWLYMPVPMCFSQHLAVFVVHQSFFPICGSSFGSRSFPSMSKYVLELNTLRISYSPLGGDNFPVTV